MGRANLTRCLEGRFTQRVNLPAPRSEARSRCPWVTAGDRRFPPVLARKWHDACRSRSRYAVGGIVNFVSSKTARLRRRQEVRRKTEKRQCKSDQLL
jgi:hypothetical protein